MSAVQDQVKRCEKLRDRFSKALSRHLGNLFVHVGNDASNLDAGGQQLKYIHKERIVHTVCHLCDFNLIVLGCPAGGTSTRS